MTGLKKVLILTPDDKKPDKYPASFPSDLWFGGIQFRSVSGGEWNNPYSNRESIPARSYHSLVTMTTWNGSRGYGV
jgi:hypothetical protein